LLIIFACSATDLVLGQLELHKSHDCDVPDKRFIIIIIISSHVKDDV